MHICICASCEVFQRANNFRLLEHFKNPSRQTYLFSCEAKKNNAGLWNQHRLPQDRKTHRPLYLGIAPIQDLIKTKTWFIVVAASALSHRIYPFSRNTPKAYTNERNGTGWRFSLLLSKTMCECAFWLGIFHCTRIFVSWMCLCAPPKSQNLEPKQRQPDSCRPAKRVAFMPKPES